MNIPHLTTLTFLDFKISPSFNNINILRFQNQWQRPQLEAKVAVILAFSLKHLSHRQLIVQSQDKRH